MPDINTPKEVWEIESLRVVRMNSITQARSVLCELQRNDKSYKVKKEHIIELAGFFESWVLRD